MLINMKEMLKVAQENQFAVPAFNIGSGQILKAVVQSANEKNAPVILAIHPNELSFLGDSFVASCIEEANKSKVPMVIHLDHGENKEQILRAIRCGFTSVMIDGSHLPYEENVAISREVVEIAKGLNVSVEGELGTIGTTGTSSEGGTDEIIYTDSKLAKDFIEKTGVDTLAIAIGTEHGIYPKGFKPELKLDLLKEIREVVDIPLVLHGGSSNPDEEIAQAVKLGVCKINISSDVKSAYYKKCREVLEKNSSLYEPDTIYPPCIDAAREVIEFKMNLFNTIDKLKCFYKNKN
ncbi:fructose-bisphosphate aldolase Fba [Clostridioides difficile]|uniref:ketose-bisphosphate aldolase n=1 Tax=Clostridioides difficile TaxID=1496 RepID=UPI0003B29CC2|nr:ketose-bisphosphate aldolase [Clostridioides difficile]MCE0686935.1 ketose-bisphosphate aldolase [Clostridioides difficile]MCE0711932.1 ketose-bisphosphate aldolase [Clostridioides difficile]MCE0719124.1 ketose-bisphosphate aldolase [Clostridioides difficile]MCE0728561.1 ketose-bisphosphate aldolase [Clostridioides difficile]QPL01507.1 ketose-bisphosphate aldolase [Clostridioides difficile]